MYLCMYAYVYNYIMYFVCMYVCTHVSMYMHTIYVMGMWTYPSAGLYHVEDLMLDTYPQPKFMEFYL